MIKLYVNPVFTNIYCDDLAIKQYYIKVFDNFLTFKTKTYYFTKAYQEGTWDGKIRMFWEYGKIIKIFTGDVAKVLKLFRQEGREFELVKSYRHTNLDIQDVELQGVKLRPYQIDAVNACKKKKRGMIACPTGGGKTEMFIKLVADINVPFVIVVNRTTLLNQIYNKIQERTGLQKSEVNVISGEIKRYDPKNYITVATFQSLMDRNLKKKTYRDVLKKAKGIIIDECHHISHNKIGEISKAAENTLYRFGYSATPYREDGFDPLLQGLMGPIIFKISISELIEQDHLAKPKIFFLKIDLDIDKRLSYDTAYESMIEHPKKNEAIAEMAYKLAKKDKKILISVKRIKHMDVIHSMIEEFNDGNLVVKKISGSNKQAQKQEAIKKLNTGEYNVVVSTLFGEGVDIPNLDVLINARSLKSSIDTLQQIGRILRMGDHSSTKIYIDFAEYSSNLSGQEGKPKEEQDPTKDYMKGYAKKRIKVCKQEPAFDVNLAPDIDYILERV